ncbi:glutathione s-transferase E2 [Anopheles sinensis]|uniref:glutathione transferase n=1 Tax=Anopheles sinensis TaxID=74873 RepID=A0A084WQQ2_ANOSI|nr:glutathione s-transferase E2 [Anopheles sinensis]
MPNIVFYTLDLSPPCRAIELTVKALGLELERKTVDLLGGDHLKPEFLKLNPQHTVPVVDDEGTILIESHAIMIYLVRKYGKDDTLYPTNLIEQARVNAMLHFETGVLFARMRFITEYIFFKHHAEIPEDRIEYVQAAYRLLEDSLTKDFVAGPKMTIADFSCISTVSSLMGFIPMEKSTHPKIYAWVGRMKQSLPHYEELNGNGATALAKAIRSAQDANRKK